MPMGAFTKKVSMSLLEIENQDTVAHIRRPISHAHRFSTISWKSDGELAQKQCYGCYEKLSRQYDRKEATK